MRPTFAIIFFTVVSGCGFGLLFWIGAAACVTPSAIPRNAALATIVLGLAFATAGLLSSLLHLGQPRRAWRALSQWRSSWLSREGVASMATFVPAVVLAGLLWCGSGGTVPRGVGAMLALLSIVTVICTAGIYTSLKTIRAWHNALVLPSYLLMAASSSACWLWVVVATMSQDQNTVVVIWIAIVFAAATAAIKVAYWRFVDTYIGESTPESATGLGHLGTVHTFEAPHTEENYLTHEMGFVLARKHSARLRMIAFVLFAAVPIVMGLTSIGVRTPLSMQIGGAIAALAGIAGLFVERWLFFAQAKHVVMLFYTRHKNA